MAAAGGSPDAAGRRSHSSSMPARRAGRRTLKLWAFCAAGANIETREAQASHWNLRQDMERRPLLPPPQGWTRSVRWRACSLVPLHNAVMGNNWHFYRDPWSIRPKELGRSDTTASSVMLLGMAPRSTHGPPVCVPPRSR